MKSSVVVLHDLYRVTHPDMFKARQRLQWKHVTARGFVQAGRLIAVSEATREAAIAEYPLIQGRVDVVHEASPIDAILTPPPRPPIDEAYGLVVANITPTKNVGLLVTALELLAARQRFPRIVLVGRGQSEDLRRIERNTSIKLTRLSDLSEEELRSYYYHARVFINTSFVEGFCLPILEAQTMGVAVICSDLPVLREVAGNGAYFINPRDAESLVSALTSLMDEDGLNSQLRSQAKQNSSRFSWKRAALETESAIDAVL